MRNDNLMVGMKVKIITRCDGDGHNMGRFNESNNDVALVKKHFDNHVFVLDNRGGSYIIGENVELLELPKNVYGRSL
jgi:hypothetical protein